MDQLAWVLPGHLYTVKMYSMNVEPCRGRLLNLCQIEQVKKNHRAGDFLKKLQKNGFANFFALAHFLRNFSFF